MTFDRHETLRSLLVLDRPVGDIARELTSLGQGPVEEAVLLRPGHVAAVLQRFLDRELGAEQVQAWAAAVVGRTDVGFAVEHEDLLRWVLLELGQPGVGEPLGRDLAERWLLALARW